MRKTTSGALAGTVPRYCVEPLAAASVSTTVRLPVELSEYLVAMVTRGQARDKTDAIVRCIRRYQETQVGVNDLRQLEASQVELSRQLGEVTEQLHGLRDDLVLVGSRSGDGLASLRKSISALLAARLYGQEDSEPPDVASGGADSGPSPALSVKLMGSTAQARRVNKP